MWSPEPSWPAEPSWSPEPALAPGRPPGRAGTSALDAGLRYLGPAARSGAEVRSFLTRKGWPAPEADQAVARLEELGILDDRRFAVAALEQAVLGRYQAPRKVAAALAAKGVYPGIIAEAVEQVVAASPGGSPGRSAAGGDDHPDLVGGGEGPGQLALAAGRTRLARLHGSPDSVARRLGAFLARQGYEAEVVEEVCSRLLGPASD